MAKSLARNDRRSKSKQPAKRNSVKPKKKSVQTSNRFTTENPTTFETIKDYKYISSSEIEKELVASEIAQKKWRETSVSDRADHFKKLASGLRDQKDAMARQMALEMGKPVKEGFTEIEKCAMTCDHYATRLAELMDPIAVEVNKKMQKVVREPLGPILAVMPWNYPLWQVIRSLVPILASGNSYLLKHSTSVAGCAELMTEIFHDVFEKGLVTNLFISHGQSEKLIADRRIRGVTMTGSSRGGREVAGTAGAHLKKVLLELGGSDAYIVLPDADLAKTAEICAKARLVNNGQSCVAAKRFIVHSSVRAEFIEAFQAQMSRRAIGNPLESDTDLGPLAHERFQHGLKKQVAQIVKEGAKKIFERETGQERGAFFSPTILLCKGSEKSLFDQEFFGPVALVTEFNSEDEAIVKANNCIYGLGGAVFSGDAEHAEEIARQLECGFVGVNAMVASDPHLPFGGVKDSGFGRELGFWGVDEFTSFKAIVR